MYFNKSAIEPGQLWIGIKNDRTKYPENWWRIFSDLDIFYHERFFEPYVDKIDGCPPIEEIEKYTKYINLCIDNHYFMFGTWMNEVYIVEPPSDFFIDFVIITVNFLNSKYPGIVELLYDPNQTIVVNRVKEIGSTIEYKYKDPYDMSDSDSDEETN